MCGYLLRRRLLPGYLLVFLALIAAPAPAQAAFSSAETLSTGGQNADSARVAVNSSGDAVFVWVRDDGTTQCGGSPGCRRIQARAREQIGVTSQVQILSDGGRDAFEPQVAVNSSGNAVFVWARFDATTACAGGPCRRIQARARSATGTLSTVQTLSATGQHAEDPQVGIDASGTAVFVWERIDGSTQCHGSPCRRIEARARSATGTLGTVQTLSAAGQNAFDPRIGVAPNGVAVFAWARPDETTQCGGGPCQRIEARSRSATGTLSAVQTPSPAGQHATSPQIAVDLNADAVLVWVRSDGTTQCGGSPGCQRIQSRVRHVGGGLGPVHTLSAANQHAFSPQVGVDSQIDQDDGSGTFSDAVFVWVRNDGTTQCSGFPCQRVQARGRSAAGALDATVTLSAPFRPSSDPRLGVDGSGNAVFVWERIDDQFVFRIQARSRSAAGVLSATESISPPGENAWGPAVAADPDGGLVPGSADAVAAWDRFDGTSPPNCCDRIQGAAQIAP